MAMAVDKPQIIEFAAHSCNYTLFQAKWIPSSSRFVVLGSHAKGTGALEIYDLDKGAIKLTKAVEKTASFKCGTFGASTLEKRHLATGDFNGNLNVWDLESLATPLFQAKGHTSIINAIDGCGGLGIGGGAPELVTGGRDGCVKVWDTRQATHVADMSPALGSEVRDCWSVAFGNSFNDEERCVVAGYDNGDIKLFDLRTMSLRWETHLENGICSVQFDRKDIVMNKLLVTGLEEHLSIYDMRTYNKDKGYASVKQKSHKSTVWCGAHLPQNRDIFISSGGNGSLQLYKYIYPGNRVGKDSTGDPIGIAGELQELNRAQCSTQPISSIDWSPDKIGLGLTTAFDQTVRVFIATKLATI